MASVKPPAVVAELGRAETLDEAADRRAEASRQRRANQTILNLVIAIVASLGIVLFLVVVVVRPTPGPVPGVDFALAAAQSQPTASQPLLVPVLPTGWAANAAKFGQNNQVESWYIGFVTPSTQFIALNQGINANPTWSATTLDGAAATGQVVIAGISWTTYDQRDADNPGNHAFGMLTTAGANTIVLHGTAPDEEFEQLAIAVAEQLARE